MSPSLTPGLAFSQVGGGDHFPVLLGDVQDGAIAEEAVGRDGGQVGALLDEMEGSVHVRAGVHDRDDPPGQHAVLRVLDPTEHLDVGLSGIRWRALVPLVTQLHHLQTRGRVRGDLGRGHMLPPLSGRSYHQVKSLYHIWALQAPARVTPYRSGSAPRTPESSSITTHRRTRLPETLVWQRRLSPLGSPGRRFCRTRILRARRSARPPPPLLCRPECRRGTTAARRSYLRGEVREHGGFG